MQNNNTAKAQDKTKAQEMYEWYQTNARTIENFAKAQDAIKKLWDTNKKPSFGNASKITKDRLLTWLQDPVRNEQNLRNLSRYLYYRSQVYYKIIQYYANMLECDIHSIIPQYDLIKKNDKNKILKSYQKTLDIVDRMNLQSNFLRIATSCLRDDVFFGCKFFEKKGYMFIMPLDADYCRITGFYNTGDLAFDMDCAYFNKYGELLEMWGEPFTSMYKEYQRTKERWQPMPDKYCACFKFRYADLDVCIPPFSGIMNLLLSLENAQDLQDLIDEQAIYKMLVATIPTIKGSKDPDDFAIDPDTAVGYFNKMCDALPDYIIAAISPIPINSISFPDDASSDVNKITKSTESVLNASGGAQVLNPARVTGTTAYKTAIRADSEFAISTLLPQIEGWVNRMLSYEVSKPCKVKFLNTTTYLKSDLRNELLESAQYGLPTKLAINTIHGFSEKDTMALNFLEEEILGVTDLFVPLQSSYTQSGDDGGGQTKDDSDLTDEGEASREKTDRA